MGNCQRNSATPPSFAYSSRTSKSSVSLLNSLYINSSSLFSPHIKPSGMYVSGKMQNIENVNLTQLKHNSDLMTLAEVIALSNSAVFNDTLPFDMVQTLAKKYKFDKIKDESELRSKCEEAWAKELQTMSKL